MLRREFPCTTALETLLAVFGTSEGESRLGVGLLVGENVVAHTSREDASGTPAARTVVPARVPARPQPFTLSPLRRPDGCPVLTAWGHRLAPLTQRLDGTGTQRAVLDP